MAKLIIMCGLAGCGKSTFVKKHMDSDLDIYVSRDDIRFSLLKEGDDYFAMEDEVWIQYIAAINAGLRKGRTVWADATHLNKKARLKLLHALYPTPTEIEVIYIKVPLEIALDQNKRREGRAKVPEDAIYRMWNSIEEPEFHEGRFTYNKIYIKEPDAVIRIKEEI